MGSSLTVTPAANIPEVKTILLKIDLLKLFLACGREETAISDSQFTEDSTRSSSQSLHQC